MAQPRALGEPWRRPTSPPKTSANGLISPERGLIARLPAAAAVNRAESVLADQSHVNDGTFTHPVVIVDVHNGGDMVTACSCTGWHVQGASGPARSIQEKYPNENHGSRYQYLVVEHGATTKPHNGLPVLRLRDRGQFKEQTYVDMGQYFQIETKHLLPYTGIITEKLVLTESSLGQLLRHLIDWSENKMPAYSRPKFITARSAGYMPVLSAECRSLAWRESFVKPPMPLTLPAKTMVASPECRTVGAYVPPHKRKAVEMSSGTAPSPSGRVKKTPRKSLECRVAN